jgi:hypothetical protein
MNMGAESAQAQPQDGEIEWLGEKPWEAAADPDAYPGANFDEEVAGGRRIGSILFGGLLILLALGWLGASGYALSLVWPGPNVQAWIGWAATISGPLILIGLAWTMFGRSSRRETRRFTQAVRAMRAESEALEAVLAIQATKLAENRAALSEDSARLMGLGDEATDRITRVTATLARESAELDRKAQALDHAAAAARVDIGVLLSDLPKVEAQARSGLEAQGQTMLAMIEQSRAAFEQAGAETTKGLAERLDLAGQKIEMLAGRLATQDQASRTLLGNIARQVDDVGGRISGLGTSGDAQNERLAAAMAA